ncbi:nitroreductase family protein [Prosthecochloris sp.]|uniref:nitroreductase family protein n=1 Tax=Prosthecochloris sp. TaxID=290513 RepID=UPI0025FA91B3|nr:nitroreductase family protein [Prosthecochloris sp.]
MNTNETIDTILKRRSVRVFKPDQVDKDSLELILEAGKYAPSAMNQQPWHFTVIRNRALLDKLDVCCKTVFLESDVEALREVARRDDFSVFYHAPILIVVTGDPGALAPQYDCTLAMQNMMLAAASMDIGSCWMHSIMMFHATEKGRAVFRELGIVFPEGYSPYAAAVFGYSAVPLPEPEPRKPDSVTIIV